MADKIFEYSEKLKDHRWKLKRSEILMRDNHTCQKCGVIYEDDSIYEFDECEPINIEVHHIHYSGEPWEAKACDLISLCEHCHDLVEHVKAFGYNMSFDEIKGIRMPADQRYLDAIFVS